LRQANALIECELDAEHVSGDHSIVVGPPSPAGSGAFGRH
jgi:hypothetical protein